MVTPGGGGGGEAQCDPALVRGSVRETGRGQGAAQVIIITSYNMSTHCYNVTGTGRMSMLCQTRAPPQFGQCAT